MPLTNEVQYTGWRKPWRPKKVAPEADHAQGLSLQEARHSDGFMGSSLRIAGRERKGWLQVILPISGMSRQGGQLQHNSHRRAPVTKMAADPLCEQSSVGCAWWLVLPGRTRVRSTDLFWFTGGDRLGSWYSEGTQMGNG